MSVRRWLFIGAGLVAALLVGVAGVVVVQSQRRPDVRALLPPTLAALPAAVAGSSPAAALPTARFAGVATLLFDDGQTAWMTDGFFTRPPLARMAFGRIAPDRDAIARGLARLQVQRLAAVVPLHGHYDHALDAPVVAAATGATLIGDASVLNVGRGLGLSEDRLRRVQPGETVPLGAWTLRFFAGRHAPTLWSDGRHAEDVDAPLVPPARASAWREGTVWSLLVAHAGGARLLLVGSAGFVPGALTGQQADVVFLGVGAVGRQSSAYRAQLWNETVRAVGARRVVLIHWDDFWRPLDRGTLEPFPYLVDDFAATLADLREFAARDGVALAMPPLFSAFSPVAPPAP